jgi:signal transduction histidine kinase
VRPRLAWAVLWLTSLAVVLDTMFTAAHRPLLSEATWADHGWPLAPLASVGCALMGALIVSRYPRHPLGWLLSAASLLSLTLAAEAYSVWVLEGDGPGTAHRAHVIAWLAPLLGWPAFVALVMVFLIAPDGRFVSARWRWAAWATGAGLALHTVGSLLSPPDDFLYGEQYHGGSAATVLLTVGYLLVAAGLIASAASLVVRLRRSRDDVRRQLLWIASSAVFLAVGVIVILAVPRIQGVEGTWLAGLPLRLAQVTVPICVAVAVLRHRLLQIEVIINRALVLALATAAVAAGYVLLVVAAGVVVRGGTTEFWPSLLATALVAVAFQPVRRRVIRAADRLAFGASATPYEALADFSRRIGDRPDPAALLPSMAEAVAQAVNARHCVVHLRLGHGSDESARWPQQSVDRPADSHTEVPVVHGGQRLGSVTVAMPPGRPLRAREHRLLSDLADQAGLAFLNTRLAAELSSKVELLHEHTDELDRSRRRLIDTSEAEHRRLEQAIANQVIPHLAALPDRLRTLSPFDARRSGNVAAELEPLTKSVASALESLREITRGVFPAQLIRAGLPAALRSLLARPHTAGELLVTFGDSGPRFDERVEAAAYFCVAQLADVLGPPVRVHLSVRKDQLSLVVAGNGPLPEPRSAHMVDRVEAVGGSMALTTASGRTTVTVLIPLVQGTKTPVGGTAVLSVA